MPRFLAPITVEQEFVTGNETISGSETILGATSGKESYWTSVSIVNGLTASSVDTRTINNINYNPITIHTQGTSNHSLVFDGDENSVVTFNAATNWGLGDFTIEFFFALNLDPATHFSSFIGTGQGFGNSNCIGIFVGNGNGVLSNNHITVDLYGSGEQMFEVPTALNGDGSWHHLALSRSEGYLTLWIDGVRCGYQANTWNVTGFTDALGLHYPSVFNGKLTNIRMAANAVYAYTDSIITVPTGLLEKVTGTKLLLKVQTPQNAYVDSSDDNVVLTLGPTSTVGAGILSFGLLDNYWNFNTNGNLTIPPSGDILRNGKSVLATPDSTKLPLSGGTLTGNLSGTTGVFDISIYATSLSGTHYGDGSRLTGIVASGGYSTDTTKLPLTGGTIGGDLTVTGTFSTVNTDKWDNTTIAVGSTSGKWNNVYNTVYSTSSRWESVCSDVSSTSGNWNTVYNTVCANSARWESVYSTTNNLSGDWNSSVNTLSSLSGNWQSVYFSVCDTSGNWNTVYNTVCANSAQWAVTIDTTKLPLSGGTINGDLLIYGGLTALSGATFINTIFQDTSALRIYNSGMGPALYVEQAIGSGDIAVFYDADGVEVLHVGNALNPLASGVVGIKTANPNKTLTVSGEISATSGVWASTYYGDGSKLTGVIAAGGVATDTSKLPLSGGVISGDLTVTGTFSTIQTDKWTSTYNTVCANSAQWAVTLDSTKLPLSGGTLTDGLTGTVGVFTTSLSSVSISGTYYGDGSNLTGVIATGGVTTDTSKLPLSGGTVSGDLTVTGTFSTTNTDNWTSTYNTVCANSAQWAVTLDSTKLALSGGTLTGGLTGTTANFSGAVYGSTAVAATSSLQLATTAFVHDSIDTGLASGAAIASTVVAFVTNADSVSLTRGTVVYSYGSQGDRVSVRMASASAEATSSKTLGFVNETIAVGGTGYVTLYGSMDKLDLGSPFVAGDTLWLGITPGTYTRTKPQAPTHLVYLGVVQRANAGNGTAYIKVQNGYELNEIHDVQIINPLSGQIIQLDSTGYLWKNVNPLFDDNQIVNSERWNNTTTTVSSNSGRWESVYSLINSTTATTFNINNLNATGAVTAINGLTVGSSNVYGTINITQPFATAFPSSFYINSFGIFDEATANNQVWQLYTNASGTNNGTLTGGGGGGIWTAGGGMQVYSSDILTFRMGANIKQGSYPTGGTNPNGRNITFGSTGNVTIGSNDASISTTSGALVVAGGVGVGGVIYASGGNSNQWNSAYSVATGYQAVSSTYATLTGTQKLENKTVVDWMTLVRGYNTTPILLATITTGDVYTYVYNSSPTNITYYRYISTDGTVDAFYTYFSGSTLSGLVASKSINL